MHQALYRKWRSRTFAEVCGQDHITSILQYEIKNDKVSHAYLFSGSRGTGKTSCAKILAKAVNCLCPDEDGNPCGKCAACVSIDNGTSTDVLEMDAASNTGVDYIRDIKEAVIYTPSMLKKRVYIIDEVHMLSTSAFNALLKTLEEPPAHVIFILATTEQQKIPVTILSRCQRFEFKRIKSSVIASRLKFIAENEGITLSDEASRLIAKLANGGMRDAISMLELCAGGGRAVDVDTVCNTAGITGRDDLEKVIRAVLNKDYETVFTSVADRYNSSEDLSVFIGDMLSYYRDILVCKRTKEPREYLELSDEEFEGLKNISDNYPYEKLAYHSSVLEEAYIQMQKGVGNKRLCAELALVKMCDEKLSTSPEALAARITALEDGDAVPMITAARAADTSKHGEKAESKIPISPDGKEDKNAGTEVPESAAVAAEESHPFRFWAELISKVGRKDQISASFLEQSSAVVGPDGVLSINVISSVAEEILSKGNTLSVILDTAVQYDSKIKDIKIKLAAKEKKNDLLDEIK